MEDNEQILKALLASHSCIAPNKGLQSSVVPGQLEV